MTKNVVLIAVDDMIDVVRYRDAFGVNIKTPNIDRLMEMGTTFENAVTPVPMCSPARAAVVTGQNPFVTGVHHNRDRVEDLVPIEETIFGAAAASGFDTWAEGKMIHGVTSKKVEDWLATTVDHVELYNGPGVDKYVHDNLDVKAANAAAEYIREHDGDNPFFLSLGMMKPHQPWNTLPQRFYDMYRLRDVDVPHIEGLEWEDLPDFYKGIIHIDRPKLDAKWFGNWAQEILNYAAAITFTDHLLGKVMRALDATDGWDDTTFVFFSDSGFHLGDRDVWGKFTLWEEATSVPFIIADPDMARGATVTTPATLLDIWPTIAGLSGMQAPEATDGVDLSVDHGREMVLTSAFGSLSIRTETWRYTLYQDGEEELFRVVNSDHAKPVKNPNQIVIDRMHDKLVEAADDWGITLAEINTRGTVADETFVAVGGVKVRGRDGDDVYHITPEDTVIEGSGKGHDTVIVSMADGGFYRLPRNVEDGEIEAHAWGRLAGNRHHNSLKGSKCGDVLKGNDGNDTLYGGEGEDVLRGGRGRDTLDGTFHDDKLFGGRGSDTFIFKSGYGHDEIKDFQNDVDTIALDTRLWRGDLAVKEVLAEYGTKTADGVKLDFGSGKVLEVEFDGGLFALRNDIDFI